MSMGQEAGHLRGDWTGLEPKQTPIFTDEEFRQAAELVRQMSIANTCGNQRGAKKAFKATERWTLADPHRVKERLAAIKAASRPLR